MDKILIHGKSEEELKILEDNSIDAIVTDPPYELGFMGKKWDSSAIAYNVELWKECLRVLKPGGHLVAFSGTRTYHRMATAIEDAGFEVRDMLEWIYAEGFPKSLNIGKKIDELLGNQRKIIGKSKSGNKNNGVTTSINSKGGFGHKEGLIDITKGNSDWEGFGTALKPAHEPIVLARKPLSEKTIVDNGLKYGTGSINDEHWSTRYGLIQIPKASKSEKNEGCDDLEEKQICTRKGDENCIVSNSTKLSKNNHPTVKPVHLMAWLIALISKKGDVVLDPFMGSGSTGVACIQLERNFIGIEMEEDYIKIAESRIENEGSKPIQMNLFDEIIEPEEKKIKIEKIGLFSEGE